MRNVPARNRSRNGSRLTGGVGRAVRVWQRLLTRGTRTGPDEFAYRDQIATGHVPLLALLAFPIELLLVVRLAPWTWLMWVLVLVSALAFAWLVAVYASFFVLPHRLGPLNLELHYGLVDEITIPIDEIERVALDVWDAPTDRDGLHRSDDGFVVSLPVAHRTQVAVLLRAPRAVGRNPDRTMRVVRFAADDAEGMARAIAARLPRDST